MSHTTTKKIKISPDKRARHNGRHQQPVNTHTYTSHNNTTPTSGPFIPNPFITSSPHPPLGSDHTYMLLLEQRADDVQPSCVCPEVVEDVGGGHREQKHLKKRKKTNHNTDQASMEATRGPICYSSVNLIMK